MVQASAGYTVPKPESTDGYMGSMSIESWIMFWRFFVGLGTKHGSSILPVNSADSFLGIGAEYPLSAVITAGISISFPLPKLSYIISHDF
jgi:hypothetical protein